MKSGSQVEELKRSAERPYYMSTSDEEVIFKQAYSAGLSIMLKGPTGCGKTRFVEAMSFDVGRPLVTVACHDDLSAADLVGRFLLRGEETVWQDGPLTKAVRRGAICYLDEVVEARQDTLVVLHPLTDHRRFLPIERLGEDLIPADGFGLVVSYNPGYQSVLKDLKPSTRQRMVAIQLDYAGKAVEMQILQAETAVGADRAERLVEFATAIRAQDDLGIREVASTRTLIAAAHLMSRGIPPLSAIRTAIIQPLTDEKSVQRGLEQIARALFARAEA